MQAAIDSYTHSIAADHKGHIVFSNRALAYLRVSLKPTATAPLSPKPTTLGTRISLDPSWSPALHSVMSHKHSLF